MNQKKLIIVLLVAVMVLLSATSYLLGQNANETQDNSEESTNTELNTEDVAESLSDIEYDIYGENAYLDSLEEAVFQAVDEKTGGSWDQNIEVTDLYGKNEAAIGHWWAWDKWDWIAYREGYSWTVLVSADGFDCDDIDLIPSDYTLFFRDVIYINKDTIYCY